ncbi:MAG: hypothetical protein KBS74_02205 [Clostridiales bacterium]|nr:hypothetical protein [Candidatus Cacconaster stercorequi]
MAETKKTQQTAYDPWKDMRDIVVPKKRNGDQECIHCSVNGRIFMVPCTGRVQKVPRPIYEVLIHSQEMRDEAERRAEQTTKRMHASEKAVNLA